MRLVTVGLRDNFFDILKREITVKGEFLQSSEELVVKDSIDSVAASSSVIHMLKKKLVYDKDFFIRESMAYTDTNYMKTVYKLKTPQNYPLILPCWELFRLRLK